MVHFIASSILMAIKHKLHFGVVLAFSRDYPSTKSET